MSTSTLVREGTPVWRRVRVPSSYYSVLATLGLFVATYGAAAGLYKGIASPQVVLNILIDNAFLLVVAVGMTFVILTGGIDLSVGSVVAMSTMISATLVEGLGWPPLVAIGAVLAIGALLGLVMGCIIHFFEIQPFIVTLAGMFLARGLCYTISTDSIPITHPFYVTMSTTSIPLPGGTSVSFSVLIAIVVLLIGGYVLHYTRMGRNVYAVGGSQQSAMLMGLPVGRTKIAAYTISGLCAALGGVLYSFYTMSGYGQGTVGLELDAIAAVVIGGTLLTGGSGYLIGSVLGVLVLGLTQTIITFDGRLSSWWTRIVIAALLFVFVVLQRVVFPRRT